MLHPKYLRQFKCIQTTQLSMPSWRLEVTLIPRKNKTHVEIRWHDHLENAQKRHVNAYPLVKHNRMQLGMIFLPRILHRQNRFGRQRACVRAIRALCLWLIWCLQSRALMLLAIATIYPATPTNCKRYAWPLALLLLHRWNYIINCYVDLMQQLWGIMVVDITVETKRLGLTTSYIVQEWTLMTWSPFYAV